VSERSESTKKGLRAEELVRQAVRGRKGVCDVHTERGGFELRWGPTTKNGHGLAADRKRAKLHGGYCVQISGRVSAGQRAHGDRSLYDFLRDHGFSLNQAARMAVEIRNNACENTLPDPDDQLDLFYAAASERQRTR
jgi:hypothetical protein